MRTAPLLPFQSPATRQHAPGTRLRLGGGGGGDPLLLLLPASSSAAIFGTLDDMELEQTGFINGNKKPFVPENPLLFILTSVP